MTCRVSVEETSEIQRAINIEIPRTEYDKRFEQRVRNTTGKAQVKGFRPGRAPRAMIVKLYGDQIHFDVVNDLLGDAYHSAVHEHALKIIGDPQFEDLSDKEKPNTDLKFRAAVSVIPEPKIQNYSDLEVDVDTEEFRAEDVEKALDKLRDDYADEKPIVDRTTAEKGDLVILDYVATVEGKPFPGSEGTGVKVEIGKTSLLPGFEEHLVGQTLGENRHIVVTFPEDFQNKDIAGKEGDYHVTLKDIRQKLLPEANDEFAKKTKLAENLQELREKLEKSLRRELEKRNREAKENRIFEILSERNTFEIPQLMVDEEIRRILFEMRLLDPQKRESWSMNVGGLRESLGKGAEFRVRRAIIASQIIAQDKLQVSDSDIDQWLTAAAERDSVSRDEVDKWYGFPESKDRLRDHILQEKLVDQLLSSATIMAAKKKVEHEEPKAEGKAKKKTKPKAEKGS